MSPLDRSILAERTMVVERHLERVAARLPLREDEFQPSTDLSDAVILHLWQATQTVIDLAMAACLHSKAEYTFQLWGRVPAPPGRWSDRAGTRGSLHRGEDAECPRA